MPLFTLPFRTLLVNALRASHGNGQLALGIVLGALGTDPELLEESIQTWTQVNGEPTAERLHLFVNGVEAGVLYSLSTAKDIAQEESAKCRQQLQPSAN